MDRTYISSVSVTMGEDRSYVCTRISKRYRNMERDDTLLCTGIFLETRGFGFPHFRFGDGRGRGSYAVANTSLPCHTTVPLRRTEHSISLALKSSTCTPYQIGCQGWTVPSSLKMHRAPMLVINAQFVKVSKVSNPSFSSNSHVKAWQAWQSLAT
jgi:hypothetical protein